MNSNLPTNLAQLRLQVDNIDAQLLGLLKERLVVTARMREAKKQQALPLRDVKREQEVLERISRLNAESFPQLPAERLREIFRTVMEWSLEAQKEAGAGEDQSSSRNQ